MNNDTHPELEQLVAFSESPDAAEHSGMRRHLADCGDCRQRLDQLGILSHSLLMAPPISEVTSLPDELLQAIENGRLTDGQQRVLNDDPVALKEALHYAIHAPAMQEHLVRPTATATPADPVSTPSLLQCLLDWRPPAWGVIPVTAAAAFALALAVLPPSMSPPDALQNKAGLIIASYADHPVLELQGPTADLPGMGFFHAADAREIPFAGLNLRYSRRDGLSANWAPVDNAKNYHLRLSSINAGDQQIIAEIDAKRPQAHFPQLQPAPGRYQWLLTGKGTDGTRFRASGGFVVNDRANSMSGE